MAGDAEVLATFATFSFPPICAIKDADGPPAAVKPAEPATFTPLRLVRDEQPSVWWSQAQFSVLSGSFVVGHISNNAASVSAGSLPWSWAINGVPAGPTAMRIHGNAATIGQAQQELAENWRRWLA